MFVNLLFTPGLYVVVRGRDKRGRGSDQGRPAGVTMTTSTSSSSARVGLLGLPSDINSSFMRGARGRAGFIREAMFSPSSNMWSETLVDLGHPAR